MWLAGGTCKVPCLSSLSMRLRMEESTLRLLSLKEVHLICKSHQCGNIPISPYFITFEMKWSEKSRKPEVYGTWCQKVSLLEIEANAPFPPDLKVGSNNPAFTPSTLSSAEPSWQMMWHGLKVQVLSLKHRPSYRYLNMRKEYRTFESVASRPCDWLLSSLSYEGTRSFINKNRW